MKVTDINTLQDAQTFVEGCINDFENGIMDKTEFMSEMEAYTMHIIITSEKQRQTFKKKQNEKLD